MCDKPPTHRRPLTDDTNLLQQGPADDRDPVTATNTKPRASLCPLPQAAVITVTGTDAQSFLHGQLSQELQELRGNDAPLAAWHSASGRVKGIFRVVSTDEDWLLLTDSDVAASLISDLTKYRLRADVSIADAGDRLQIAAIVGDADDWLSQYGVNLGSQAGNVAAAMGSYWLRIGPQLVYVLKNSNTTFAEAEFLSGQTEDVLLAEISLGIPRLTIGLQDHFLPQMLNLDRLSALNDRKGCYPGQEIIARTQNLGTVKRRMVRFSVATGNTPASGSKVIDQSGDAVGEVIRAAASTAGVEILAVTRLADLERPLTLEGDSGGHTLQRLPLPYED
jgi:tRNA-modifying protein YgfZ